MRHCRGCVWCWLRYMLYVRLLPELYTRYADVICPRCRENDLLDAMDYLIKRVGQPPDRLLYLGDDENDPHWWLS